MFKSTEVKRVSTVTIYRLLAIGLTMGFIPLVFLSGAMAVFGIEILTLNGQPLTGSKLLFIGPLAAIFMAAFLTVMLGSVTVLGLWLYSFFKSINIEYIELDE